MRAYLDGVVPAISNLSRFKYPKFFSTGCGSWQEPLGFFSDPRIGSCARADRFTKLDGGLTTSGRGKLMKGHVGWRL